MKKILFAFALVGMFGFAACDKKDDAAKPADTKKPDDKGAMKPADSAAKPADTKPADKPADSAAKPADTAGGGDIGVPECDDYVKKYSACISDKMPEAGREQAKAAVKQMQDAWKQAASTPEGKSALAQGCKQALDAAKQATQAMGCTW